MAGREKETGAAIYTLLYLSLSYGEKFLIFKYSNIFLYTDTVIFLGFVVVYNFHALFYLGLFMLYSIWVPQIICNVTQYHRNSLLKKYVVGMTITRLCIPMCTLLFISSSPLPCLS